MRRAIRMLIQLVVLLQLLQLLDAGRLFSRTTVPVGWQSLGRASSSSTVRFTIGLRSATVDDMQELFVAITDPASPQYLDGQLSGEEVERRFGASLEDRQRVRAWLRDAGLSDAELRDVSSAIEVTARVDAAERLFSTELRRFQRVTDGKLVIKAWGAASLPDEVHAAVDLVTGLSSFPVPHRRSHSSSRVGQQGLGEAVLPQSIRSLYQIRAQKPGSSTATQAVIEFGGQWFDNNDTAQFAQLVGYTQPNASIAPIPPEHIVGVNNPSEPGIESTLDVQMIAPTNMEVETWFWYDGDSSWLYEFALHMLNTTNPPQVNSISYGLWEGMQCFADPAECELMDLSSAAYTAATNALFMRLAMQGVAIVVASGDSGANSRTDETCAAYNLRPEYPASSPYVTTVGATMVVNATYGYTELPICAAGNYSCISGGREVAVSRNRAFFTSGGGFSNITGAGRPSWQNAAVTAYLNSGVALPPSSYYNANGRGEPDVSAVGSMGLMVIEGQVITEGGTSMASPIFAGVASLLNEIALAKTGKPLGFLNPLLSAPHTHTTLHCTALHCHPDSAYVADTHGCAAMCACVQVCDGCGCARRLPRRSGGRQHLPRGVLWPGVQGLQGDQGMGQSADTHTHRHHTAIAAPPPTTATSHLTPNSSTCHLLALRCGIGPGDRARHTQRRPHGAVRQPAHGPGAGQEGCEGRTGDHDGGGSS